MTRKVARFIKEQYPSLGPLIDRLGPLQQLRKQKIPIPEAVVRVTIGQMLSSGAARAIYRKVTEEADRRNLNGTWLLDRGTLRRCGLSGRKIRTIKEFAHVYAADPSRFRSWRTMESDQLFAEVRGFWGMSDWSAAMLGIFYFAHEDIFPETDGSILRAIALLPASGYWRQRNLGSFDANKARPYRSYLALYLWKALDEGILG